MTLVAPVSPRYRAVTVADPGHCGGRTMADVALDHLLEGLNEPQHEAVTDVDGPLLVLAGVR